MNSCSYKVTDNVSYLFEFLGNSLTQTNQTRLYLLDCWIQIVQFDEQNKNLTK